MTEAWMKRGVERQEFLLTLDPAIFKAQEGLESRLAFQIPFAVAILAHLAGEDKLGVAVQSNAAGTSFLREKILPRLKEFARTDEEARALLADVLKAQIESIDIQLRSPLQKQEIMEPGRVFDGRHAMDNV